ncbi:MAG: CocE/NonD family hydrolase, partial [Candidatus Heimdallarchaeota archaeon]|nr:CocE/NonD family hydrolase [Candidatus Heimdallarchaeota archaeon]
MVKVDVRGTGASFGTRPGEYTPIEVNDAYSVIDWIVKQSWSSGSIGAYGTSYSGTTAELLCASNHPAVKAVIPGWSDFDTYRSPVRPYGMFASGFISEWSQYVEMLDNNASDLLKAGVRKVDVELLEKALAEHKGNPNVFEMTKNSPYRDSKIGEYTYEECSPIHWKKEIVKSKVPMLVLTSWMDAGTADGTLLRLQHFDTPQKVVMMATSHGGWAHASPFVVDSAIIPPLPSIEEQYKLRLDFFDQYLKGKSNHVENWPAIKYYNLGEEVFKESEVWPPIGQSRKKYFFSAEGSLETNLPEENEGKDAYTIDFSLSTGVSNRWRTQGGKPVLNLNNRNSCDSLMLTYTSCPLEMDLQITGTPVITLQVSSTHEDGAVFVYLEDVDENGNSRYITEGGLRLIHRKLSKNPQFEQYPYHSFNKADVSPMEPNKVEE